MNPIHWAPADVPEGWRAVTYGEGQQQYQPLPSITNGEQVRTRWQPTAAERAAILAGADIELTQWTFGGLLQPVSMGLSGA